ncbi:hypothetical protein [Streptomyces sp. NPDC002324]
MTTRFTPGQCISRDYSDGSVSTVRVGNVDRWRLSYTCSDGVSEAVEANVFKTLDEQLSGYRDATAEETAKFEACYRPAPENWN